MASRDRTGGGGSGESTALGVGSELEGQATNHLETVSANNDLPTPPHQRHARVWQMRLRSASQRRMAPIAGPSESPPIGESENVHCTNLRTVVGQYANRGEVGANPGPQGMPIQDPDNVRCTNIRTAVGQYANRGEVGANPGPQGTPIRDPEVHGTQRDEAAGSQMVDNNPNQHEQRDNEEDMNPPVPAGQAHPLNRRERRRQEKNKPNKAHIRVATLNINGFTAARETQRIPGGKWANVKAMMYEKRIGILLVQEAHLDERREHDLQELFQRQLTILNSADPENPRARAVPGRAMLARVKTAADKTLTILNVYAPNRDEENRTFWETLNAYFEQNPAHKPDIMAGDFNIVEDRIDRLPMRDCDPEATVNALDDLKSTL
ncbi:hypothetical protein CPC08DRAFT_770971 [Agrocybe pediades]|nr:hypothetical protein CPC08DRAFT_770971 [Agrocybe pediades]